MPAVQMNVRIDEDLKRAGDAVFEKLGVTTSQVVRSVWEYAAKHCDDPEEVRKRLGLDLFIVQNPERNLRVAAATRGSAIVSDFCTRYGLAEDLLRDEDERDLDDVREQALYERWSERGLA